MPVSRSTAAISCASTAALGVALPFASGGGGETDLVARKVFFDNPDSAACASAPTARPSAWLAPIGGVRNLFVAPLAGSLSPRAR